MDRATLFGLLLGGLALFGGHYLEGGGTSMIFQVTAFVIVVGGTAGAVCLSFTGAQLGQSCRELPHIFRKTQDKTPKLIEHLVKLAYRARREGLLALAEGEHPRFIAERLNSILPQGAPALDEIAASARVRPLPLQGQAQVKSHAPPSIRSH